MATKRRPLPKKQPSPPPQSDSEVDEDVRSSSEEEPKVEQDRKPLESESSDDDGEETGGEGTGEDEYDSEPEPDRIAPEPPRQRDVAAGDEDDEDGEEDSESGEEDSESEEEQPIPFSQNSNVARPAEANGNPLAKKSLLVTESEEEDSESGEEDSESEEVLANPSPRSSAFSHLENDNGNPSEKKSVPVSQSGEDDSESEEEQLTPSSQNTAIANGNPLDKKLVLVSNSGKVAGTPTRAATGETAKKLFQRIWSDEDQIALLQGMVDYVGSKAKDPVANIDEFGLFIRKKLSFPVTQSQLLSKIKRVKKKYRSRSTSIDKGKEKPFSKPYDAEVFELSKKVWGAVSNVENEGRKKGKGVKKGESGGGNKRKGIPSDKAAVRDSPSGKLLVGTPWDYEIINLCKEHFGCDEYSAMEKINSMDEFKWNLLLPRWKKLKTDEVRCFANRRSLELDSLETIFNSSS